MRFLSVFAFSWLGVLPCLAAAVVAAPSGNLVVNSGFEAAPGPRGQPPKWFIYVPSGTATAKVVADNAREGRQCLFLQTGCDMKAVAVSEPIPVAPGEKLRLSVWCRAEGLATTHGGALAFSAGFQDRQKTYFAWHRASPEAPADGQWSQLTTEAVVPANAAYVTFQVGFRMLTGSTWWDAAELTTASPVAVRFGPLAESYELGSQAAATVLLNRDPRCAGMRVRLKTEPGGREIEHVLTSAAEEAVRVPCVFSRRGKVEVRLSLLDDSTAEVLFKTSAKVTVPELLRMEPVLPTHFCVEDGPPQLEGRLWVHEEEEVRKQLVLECSLVDAAERALATWRGESLPANPIAYRLKPEKCGRGDYSVRVRLRRGQEVVGQAVQDWHVIGREQAEVKVGPDGFLRVGGKPFLPIGMFNGGRYPEQAAAGFNTTHHYGVMHTLPDQTAPNQFYKDILDRTQAAGMKALVLVTHGGPKARHLGPEVVRSIRTFRNHPALLAWDEEEGVARGETPLSFLDDLQRLIRRESPHRPLLLGDTRDAIQKITDRSGLFAEQYMDLGMWWWYPFPISPAAVDDALQGTQRGRGMEIAPPTFLTAAQTTKPLWVGLQAYRSPDRRDGRFPTPTEYRAQAYLALIHGAKGLMYYVGSGSRGYGILNRPEEGHWEQLKAVVGELRQLEPVILSPDARDAVAIEPQGAPISVRMKEVDGGGKVLLAANRDNVPVEARFTSSAIQRGTIVVRFEGRSLPARPGTFTDRFGPYEVRVYELSGGE